MNVLHVVSSFAYGGGPMHVLTLARGLRELDIECVVAGPDGLMREQFKAAGFDPWLAVNLRTVVWNARTFHSDVIHTHGKLPGLLGRYVAWRRKIPVVHTFHG